MHTAQGVVGLLCCQGTLLARVLLAACQDLHLLVSRAAPQPISPQPTLAQGSLPSWVQDYAFGLAEFHRSSCQPVPPACLKSHWMAALPSSVLNCPNLMLPAHLRRVHFIVSPRLLITVLKWTGPRIDPCARLPASSLEYNPCPLSLTVQTAFYKMGI